MSVAKVVLPATIPVVGGKLGQAGDGSGAVGRTEALEAFVDEGLE